MRATYYDPRADRTVDVEVKSSEDFERLADLVVGLESGCGIPTIDLFRPGGLSLSFSSDHHRAFLVWFDALGDSHHSVGGGFDEDLVFNYMGSWSDAPGEYLVPYADAVDAVRGFLETGSPVTPMVIFSPE